MAGGLLLSRLNMAALGATAFTHEQGPAFAHMTPEQALRRSVMSCMLWEDEFYEDGVSIANFGSQNGLVTAGIFGSIGIPNPDALQEFKI